MVDNAEIRRKAAADIVSALGFPAPAPSNEEKKIYTNRILEALHEEQPEATPMNMVNGIPYPNPTAQEKDIYLQRILSALGPDESVNKRAAANTGLGYITSAEPEDVLVPNKPNIDWFSGDNAKGVDEAAVLSALAVEQPAVQQAIAQQAATPQTPTQENKAPIDLSKLDLSPQRRRRSNGEQALAMAKDVFDFVSGVDPNAYIGKTLEVMNKYDKTRMEEDPEGYQADMNRAKVLSQKAQEEKDPVRKAIYGREIKKLLPKETEGLSDEVAADYFTAGLDNKIKLEQLKGYNKLQEIAARNKGNITVQSMKNMSAKEINDAKMQTQREISDLNREYQYAKLANDNERAKIIQDMIADRMINLANINNAAQIEKEAYKADRAMEREVYKADAAQKRVETQQEGAYARALASKGQMSPETAKQNWPMEMEKFNSQQRELQEALDLMAKEELFGPVAGRIHQFGGNEQTLKNQARVKGIISRVVQQRLQQVRQAAGTGRAADTEREAERILSYLSSKDTVPQAKLVGALEDFMKASAEAMRLREMELFGNTNGASRASTNASTLQVGQSTQIGKFKVTRRS